jgi:hypothetical protein
MSALAARSHGMACSSFWRWAVLGAALGVAWAVLGPSGAFVLVAVLAATRPFRRRVASPPAFGLLTGFGAPLLWIGATAPTHRATAWYVVGAGCVVLGVAAFALVARSSAQS